MSGVEQQNMIGTSLKGAVWEGCAAIPEKRKFLFVLGAAPSFVFV